MSAYLDLVAAGKINLAPLTDNEYCIDEAARAYADLRQPDTRVLAAVLSYGESAEEQPPAVRSVRLEPVRRVAAGKIGVGLIGAGAFAQAVQMPNLAKLGDTLCLKAVADNDGVKAKETAAKFSAPLASTDYREILDDNSIDMVLIATYHDTHARIAIDALKAGKAVFLEKPMALSKLELQELTAAIDESDLPFTVGFNRRFSPFAEKVRNTVSRRSSPLMIDYQMNAGFMPPEHWVHGEVGGGRNIGEACHIYDLFTYLTDSRIKSVTASSVGPGSPPYGRTDNFVATLVFEDGSVCNLVYTALGSTEYPKEQMKIYVDRTVTVLDDYMTVITHGAGKSNSLRLRRQDKGHFELLRRFADVVSRGGKPPIPLWQLVQATEISFEVDRQIRR